MLLSFLMQSALSLFLSSLSGNAATFSFTWKLAGETEVGGRGEAALSESAFRFQDELREMWCCDSVRWTVDKLEEEVYVEPVDGLNASSVLEMFSVSGSSDATFSGRKAAAVTLLPGKEVKDLLKSVTLYLDGAEPLGLDMVLPDGAGLSVSIGRYEIRDAESVTFCFDTSTLPADYVVTDLR